jgi:hypothetical protein
MRLADIAIIHVVIAYTSQENGIAVSVDDTLTIGLQDTSRHNQKLEVTIALVLKLRAQ